jgi:GWxTD domain-containing protein
MLTITAGRRPPILPLLLVLLAAVLPFAGCASGGVGMSPGELSNPLLGPDYSNWLVGPVSLMASHEEIQGYLALHDDHQATEFIKQFWARRNPTQGPGNPLLTTFEERADAADHKFTEGVVLGRHTDRGAILVIYGPPQKTGFEVPPRPTMAAIEVWDYAAGAPAGLNGKHPDRAYRFTKRDELTVRYVAPVGTPQLQPAAH